LRIEIVEECEHGFTAPGHLEDDGWTDSDCPGGSRRPIFEAELLTLVADLLKGRGLLLIPDENGWPPEVRAASRSAMGRVGLVGFVDAFLMDLVELQAVGVLVDGPKEGK
jgi:hypothetical protein